MTIYVENIGNEGCNNGSYPRFVVVDANNTVLHSGITCRCYRGCNNTTDIRQPLELGTQLVVLDSSEFDLLVECFV